MRRLCACLALAAACSPPAAGAGELAVAAEGGTFDFTWASKSTKAVFGSSGGAAFGGSVAYRFANGLYLSAGARLVRREGERVFAADAASPAFGLGHPLNLRLVPVTATVGYRFRRQALLVPYVGLGVGFAASHEESDTAGEIDTFDQTKAAAQVVAGLEVGRGRVKLAAEVGLLSVPDGLGLGGVSQVYGEKDAGGVTAAAKVIVTFGRR